MSLAPGANAGGMDGAGSAVCKLIYNLPFMLEMDSGSTSRFTMSLSKVVTVIRFLIIPGVWSDEAYVSEQHKIYNV